MKIKKAGILIGFISLLFLSACTNKQENAVTPQEPFLEQQSGTEIKAQGSVQETIEEIDLSNSFNGINGCAVLYSPKENKYSLYNSSMCRQEVSPYSTFKIISALAGLENGIIKDETSTMNYNGSQYTVSEWNRNLTLQEAFKTSCIWYFRQVIDGVGADETARELNVLQYGNCDISQWKGSGINPQEELNGFWLNSSLKISPLEQVQVLSKIFEKSTSFHDENIDILKNIMFVKQSNHQKIYGKTGSGSDGKAWFVGFKEEDGTKEYFAIYLHDEEHKEFITGNVAKEIALKII